MDIQFHKKRLLNAAPVQFLSNDSDPGVSACEQTDQLLNPAFWNEIVDYSEKFFRVSRQAYCSQYDSNNSDDIRVTCVMPILFNHNFTYIAVNSVLQQSRHVDHLILLIDDSERTETSSQLSIIKDTLDQSNIKSSIYRYKGVNGPYRMLNRVVERHDDSDFLWLHDSDDISHSTRLEKQLEYALYHRLDICGSFELRLGLDNIKAIQYPINVTRALMVEPGHCMLWPSSLIRRSLWRKLQGCSDEYTFGADTEFQLRACFIARMANIPSFLYARRVRPESLTGCSLTGHGSALRGYVNSTYKAEYYKRKILLDQGEEMTLEPCFKIKS